MEFVTKSPQETKKLGEKVAADLVINYKPLIIALTGELGSGKTTFTQGFAKGLGIKKPIISPSFILMRSYELAKSNKIFYHLDLYRLETNLENEIENLGVKDIWSQKDNVLIIEWAEKIKNLLPEDVKWIEFEYLSENKRKIIIS